MSILQSSINYPAAVLGDITNSRLLCLMPGSLAKKITSLIDMFREKDLHFVLLNETWFKGDRETNGELAGIKDAEKIEFICKNRGSRGGGYIFSLSKVS